MTASTESAFAMLTTKASSVVGHLSTIIADWEAFLPDTHSLNRERACRQLKALRSELWSALSEAPSVSMTEQPTSGQTKSTSISNAILEAIEGNVRANARSIRTIALKLEEIGKALKIGDSG